jgi:transposase
LGEAGAVDRALCGRCHSAYSSGSGPRQQEHGAYYFHRLREVIDRATEDATPFSGAIEVDESYFGGSRKGKRGRGAAGKVPVFGLLKRGGKLYAKAIPNVRGKTLKAILDQKIVPDSMA